MIGTNWDDLKPRVLSGIVMAVVGAGAVWAGGYWFMALIAISNGLMVWELVRMVAPEQTEAPVQLGIMAFLAVVLSALLPALYSAPLLLAPIVVGLGMLKTNRILFAPYAILILLAGYGFIQLRQDFGLIWMLWLIAVVAATDTAGYIAGRIIGGPKFWPKISPKKTWSGTIAGWIAAAGVGYCFYRFGGLIGILPVVSVFVAFASQMGDIAESAIKRKTGIKDSSNLIPGHGGFMDRFDGMLGASTLLIALLTIAGVHSEAILKSLW